MATPFSLSEEDLRPAALDSDAAAEKIPILRRRAANDGAKNDPTCVIVVGMAGSGKTTLMAQLQRSLNLKARDGGPADGGGSVGVSDSSVTFCAYDVRTLQLDVFVLLLMHLMMHQI